MLNSQLLAVMSTAMLFIITTGFIYLFIWQATQPTMPRWCIDLLPVECIAASQERMEQ